MTPFIFMRNLKFLLLLPALVMSQENEQAEADAILDDLFAVDSLEIMQLLDDIKQQDYVYINSLYNSKTLFSGRDFGVNQFSFFPSISYIDSNNLFLNISTGYFSGVNPEWDFVTLSGGYSNYLTKNKSILASATYSYSSFSQDVAELNNQRLSASLSYRKKWFRNTTTFGYLFGGVSSYFISNNIYVDVELLKTETMELSFQPRFGLFWGNQTITELVSTGIRFNPFELVDRNVFQLLNAELSLPMAVDLGSWDLELAYTFAIPNALPGEENLENTAYFSVSLGYLVGL